MSFWSDCGLKIERDLEYYSKFTEEQAKEELENLCKSIDDANKFINEFEEKHKDQPLVGDEYIDIDYAYNGRDSDKILAEELVKMFPSLKEKYNELFG